MKKLLLLVLISGLFATDETKQQKFYIGTMGVAFPNTQFGMLIGQINPKSVGWFGEIRGGYGIPEDDEYDRSVKWAEETMGDSKIDEKNIYASYLGGINYLTNSKKTILYVGFGITKASNYNQYYDPFEILGNDGKYWIEDDADYETITSFTAGIIFIKMKYSDDFFLTSSFSILSSPFNVGISLGTEW